MFGLFRKSKYTEYMFVGELGELQKELTELALRIGKENYGTRLDFSHNSVKKVEEILADIHRQYINTGNTEGLTGIALEFGAYIAAVVQKQTEYGELKRDHPQIGKNTFPFYWGDEVIFTYGWCEKRILDGAGDNVWSKYRSLVLEKIRN